MTSQMTLSDALRNPIKQEQLCELKAYPQQTDSILLRSVCVFLSNEKH